MAEPSGDHTAPVTWVFAASCRTAPAGLTRSTPVASPKGTVAAFPTEMAKRSEWGPQPKAAWMATPRSGWAWLPSDRANHSPEDSTVEITSPPKSWLAPFEATKASHLPSGEKEGLRGTRPGVRTWRSAVDAEAPSTTHRVPRETKASWPCPANAAWSTTGPGGPPGRLLATGVGDPLPARARTIPPSAMATTTIVMATIRRRRRRLRRCASLMSASAGSAAHSGAGLSRTFTSSSPPPADHSDSMNSTMLPVKIDSQSSVLLFEQVAAELRRAIAEGEARPGERLPPAKDLAAVLGVNSNTVLRALRQLRDEGLLEFRRGRGVTVSGQAPARSAVIARARDLVQFSRRQGYRHDELIQIIETIR